MEDLKMLVPKKGDADVSIVCCRLYFLPLLISRSVQVSLYGSSSSLSEGPFAAGHHKLLIQASEGPHQLALLSMGQKYLQTLRLINQLNL